ncbi:MAG: twin-arginine translocase TatA/TatE family subunit [Rickettsiales bacterium]|nr:twin-arginine translocase TatA/TatE family subunit [Rickettsiales bacterium]MCA0254515.1 twin-arginine translocase TatA/TatE family subunit [Pseudomonadota bacterium]
MGISIFQLLLVLLIILVLFGAGKLPQVMSDLGKGLKAFKSSMKDEDKDKDNEKK